MKDITIRAGERTRVLRRLSSSIPQRFSFAVEPLAGSAPVSGTVEVAGSRWLFSKPPLVLDLQPTMTVAKGYWDTRFAIYITANQDARVTFR
jgi:hypothetical protein